MLNGQKMSLRNVSPQWSGKHRFLLREEGILKAEMCLKTEVEITSSPVLPLLWAAVQ